ncbi:MAG TPA: cytochrome c [Bdellovibrionales bacterium]|nr:cytochrome c [Bdellovibrionales bacterium]
MNHVLLLLLAISVTCTKKPSAPKTPLEEGRSLYQTHCTACHSANPAVDGALGPGVAGSSLELLESRLLHAGYPAGYTPKRPTKVMVALPFLKDKIPALHAYLNSP